MRQVRDRLWVGNLHDCEDAASDWAVVHACKDPCHKLAVGYSGSLPDNHEHYLAYHSGRHLFLNMIDPPVPLFKAESFRRATAFIAENIGQRNVLVHCNHGLSRSPSITLLWLAKATMEIPGATYEEARTAFQSLYPEYDPGLGIQTFLATRWDSPDLLP
jgi:hypothetical protein